jgi:hypothetical protein
MPDYNVIFTGASATNSPWPSWKDFVITRYGLNNIIENAYRGVGNEFMVDSTIHQCKKVKDPFVMIMLTMVDKWDWFVSDPGLSAKISAEEKHPLRDLDGAQSSAGYWSTGVWFPKYKEYYKEHYYSEAYQFAQTLKNLYVLQSFLTQNNIPNLILFDCPILSCTEEEMIQGIWSKKDYISNNQLAKVWHDLIDWEKIYTNGFIGYCIEHNLEKGNKKYGLHPPSTSHLAFCKDKIFPELDKTFEVKCDDQDFIAKKFLKLYHL